MLVGTGLAVSAVTSDADIDVMGTHDVSQSTSLASVDVDGNEGAGTAANDATTMNAVSNLDAVEDQTKSSTSVSEEQLSTDIEHHCFLRQLSDTLQHASVPAASKSGAVFLKSSWRQHLCRCPSCLVSWVYGTFVYCFC